MNRRKKAASPSDECFKKKTKKQLDYAF